MKVLIAEDSAPARALLRSAVERLGHDVLVAEDGLEAWEVYQQLGADVVISDWIMPGLEGPELCRRIRAQQVAYTYFIFLTMLEDRQHALDGMRAGADDYLTKPLDFDELNIRLIAAARVTSLHRELARREAERERSLRRREALLRVARRFAGVSDPKLVLRELLEEAIGLLDGGGGAVTSWDESSGLAKVLREQGWYPPGTGEVARPGEAAACLALNRRAAVLVDEDSAPGLAAGSAEERRAAVAVPLLHEGRLLGALSVTAAAPGQRYSGEDADHLELLASAAAATLVGLERARLEAVLLTARTAQHELNNRLAVTRGYVELLSLDRELPDRLRGAAREAVTGVAEAARILDQLQRIARVEETDWGPTVGPTIDLAASTAGRSAQSTSPLFGSRRATPVS